jgi:hypothetical protein
MPVKLTAVVAIPLHTDWLAGTVTFGVGFTVTENIWVAPEQLLAEGVTVITPVAGVLPVFVPVNGEMFPVPVDASPIEELVFDHVNVVPLTAPVKVTPDVEVPLHTVWLAIASTVGVGFTVIVNTCGVPALQSVEVGVTVNVAVTGVVPLFMAVNDAILPVPVEASPMLVLLLAHI